MCCHLLCFSTPKTSPLVILIEISSGEHIDKLLCKIQNIIQSLKTSWLVISIEITNGEHIYAYMLLCKIQNIPNIPYYIIISFTYRHIQPK